MTKRFDRHQHMNAETRSEIMELISEVSLINTENSFQLQNMMYGLYDGYLYEDVQLYALEMPTEIASRIIKVYDICNRYPQLETTI